MKPQNKKDPPLVSVLMPAYNAGNYIAEAVESVLRQTFSDFELIIINDGSTDDTLDVLKRFHDPRIIIQSQKNAGVSAALNHGLSIAKGEYICRFDADDVCFAHRIAKQVSFLNEHKEYCLVGGDAEYIMEDGTHLFNFKCIGYSHDEIISKLYFYCPFIHSAVMYRKKEVVELGGYSLHAHTFEDYLLWTKLSKKGKFCNLPEQLIKVRFNASSVTIDEKWRGERFRELKRNAVVQGSITKEDGDEILAIIQSQDTAKIKRGSYHALCAKKFLVDNYRPGLSRHHAVKAISLNPLRLDNYALFIVSFTPHFFIKWLHNKRPNRL
jgi:Glycosyl transferase family 2